MLAWGAKWWLVWTAENYNAHTKAFEAELKRGVVYKLMMFNDQKRCSDGKLKLSSTIFKLI